MYTKRARVSRFTYGKTILSTQIWKDMNTQDNNYIINFKCSITSILVTANQFQVSQVFSEFTDSEGQEMQDEFMVLEDYGKIQGPIY